MKTQNPILFRLRQQLINIEDYFDEEATRALNFNDPMQPFKLHNKGQGIVRAIEELDLLDETLRLELREARKKKNRRAR